MFWIGVAVGILSGALVWLKERAAQPEGAAVPPLNETLPKAVLTLLKDMGMSAVTTYLDFARLEPDAIPEKHRAVLLPILLQAKKALEKDKKAPSKQ